MSFVELMVSLMDLAKRASRHDKDSLEGYRQSFVTLLHLASSQLKLPNSQAERLKLADMGENNAVVMWFDTLIVSSLGTRPSAKQLAMALMIRDHSGYYLPCLMAWIRGHTEDYRTYLGDEKLSGYLPDLFDHLNAVALAVRSPEGKYVCRL